MGEITREQFDKLLAWLDSDRDAAGVKYEKIRLRLIKIFACRGCHDAEQLADKTIDRVAGKIDWLIANYVGDPVLYFYGVGQKVFLEEMRPKPKPPKPHPTDPNVSTKTERDFECLDQCLAELSSSNCDLVTRYYQGEKKEKINNRRKLADELGITLDALRIRAHRVRKQLQACVLRCVALNPAQ